MTRLGWVAGSLVVVGSLAFACTRAPAHGGVVVQSSDECVTCHLGNFQAAVSPAHDVTNFSLKCGFCHTTAAWSPADQHPEATIAVKTGPHAVVACMDCHDQSITQGYKTNSNCIDCHTGEHSLGDVVSTHPASLIPDFASAQGTGRAQNFCMNADCHPDALRHRHTETAFPTLTGPHVNLACIGCHDQTIAPGYAKANTNCIVCHPRTTTGSSGTDPADSQHAGVSAYAANAASGTANFCLTCHPDGMGGGGHPENLFPLLAYPSIPFTSRHRNIVCENCHDQTISTTNSKANTNCIVCHPPSTISPTGADAPDSHHGAADIGTTKNAQYVSERDAGVKNFCADAGCHPTGSRNCPPTVCF